MTTDAKLLYFFPDNMIPEELQERLKKCAKRGPAKGPGNQKGTLVCPHDVKMLEYDKKGQIWTKIKNYYIGYAKDFKPVDFQREHIRPGYPVILGDGREWQIPIALADSPNFSFPQYETILENGSWGWKVQEKYEFICEVAKKLYESVDDGYNFSLDDEILRRACCAVIDVNYNLTDIECGVLKLLTHEAYQGIVSAVLDGPGFLNMLKSFSGKKKVSA